MERNSRFSETSLIETALESIRSRLPPGWRMGYDESRYDEWTYQGRVDATFRIRDPQGHSAVIRVEANRRPIAARQVLLQMKEYW